MQLPTFGTTGSIQAGQKIVGLLPAMLVDPDVQRESSTRHSSELETINGMIKLPGAVELMGVPLIEAQLKFLSHTLALVKTPHGLKLKFEYETMGRQETQTTVSLYPQVHLDEDHQLTYVSQAELSLKDLHLGLKSKAKGTHSRIVSTAVLPDLQDGVTDDENPYLFVIDIFAPPTQRNQVNRVVMGLDAQLNVLAEYVFLSQNPLISYKVDGLYVVGDPSNEGTDSPILTDENGVSQAGECIICMVQTSDVVLVPCRHVCLCGDCAVLTQTHSIQRHCPCCRTPVGRMVQLGTS